jgi:inner membrane protein
MLLRTHLMFSLSVWLVLNYFLEMPFWVLAVILFSTAFVDIDVKGSRFGKKWFFRPLQWITKHRGFFHSLFAAVLFSLIVGMINLWAGFGFFVGYISHLFIDCFTKSGVALFWPFKFKFKGPIRSGRLFETVFFVLLLLGNVLAILWLVFYI